MYFRGSCGVLLCFDLSVCSTLESVKTQWIEDLIRNRISPLKVVLLGMKSDKVDKPRFKKEIEEWSNFHHIPYFETSSYSYRGMDEPIFHLIKSHRTHLEKEGEQKTDFRPVGESNRYCFW